MNYLKKHLQDHIEIATKIDLKSINAILKLLINLENKR